MPNHQNPLIFVCYPVVILLNLLNISYLSRHAYPQAAANRVPFLSAVAPFPIFTNALSLEPFDIRVLPSISVS